MAHTQATILGRAIKVTFPEGNTQLLLVEVTINCPDCGRQELRLGGHHLHALKRLCEEWIEAFPDLTGRDDRIQEQGRTYQLLRSRVGKPGE